MVNGLKTTPTTTKKLRGVNAMKSMHKSYFLCKNYILLFPFFGVAVCDGFFFFTYFLVLMQNELRVICDW